MIDNIIKATFYPRKMGGLALQNFHPMSLLQPFVGTISNSLFEEMTCNVKPSILTGGGRGDTHRGHTDDLLTHNLFIYSNSTQLFTNPPLHSLQLLLSSTTHVLFVSSLLNFYLKGIVFGLLLEQVILFEINESKVGAKGIWETWHQYVLA